MDEAGVSQALASTFVLGILSHSVFVAFVIYIKGHGRTLLQDRRRLVLITFLTFAALWAQFAFISLFIYSQIGCHVTVLLSVLSDQAARATISGLLLWTFAASTQSVIGRYALRSLVGLRIALGGVFTGFTGPQLTPMCVATSRNLPLAIATVSYDAVIVCVLGCCIYQWGFLGGSKRVEHQDGQSKKLALTSITFGFFVWSSMSVPSQLSLGRMVLFSRVAIPGIGLFILLVLMIMVSGSFPSTKRARAVPPETPTLTRELGGPGPVRIPRGDRIMGTWDPLHANPVDPRDVTPQTMVAMADGGHPVGSQKLRSIPTQARAQNRDRSSGSVFRSIIGAPLSGTEIVITGNSTLPLPPKPTPVLKSTSGITRGLSKSLRKQRSLRGNLSALKISEPMSIGGPGPSIKTMGLAEAAELQRRRQREQQANRDRYLEAGLLTATRKAPDPPGLTSAEALRATVSLYQKEISLGSPNRRPPAPPVPRLNESDSFHSTPTTSDSLQLKGSDEERRQSPRASRHPEETFEIAATMNHGLPGHVKLARHPARFAPPIPAPTVSDWSPTVTRSGLNVISAVILAVPSPTEPSHSVISIMERKRPKVDKMADRTIFPTRESHLRESMRLTAPFTQRPDIVDLQNAAQRSTVPTKVEPLIQESASGVMGTGVEHKFPEPPSSLPLPRFSEFFISHIPSINGSPVKPFQHDAESIKPSPQAINPMGTVPLRELLGDASQSVARRSSTSPSSRGIVQAPPEALKQEESRGGEVGIEARQRPDTIKQTTNRDNSASSANNEDFEMDIPIRLGYDVRSIARPNKWHYRIGDKIPLFSESRRLKGSKTMPPPVPLLLQPTIRYSKTAIPSQGGSGAWRTREKEHRLQQDTLESTDRESVKSPARRDRPDSALFRGRRTLLEKLEMELSLKEQDWLQLQENFDGSATSSSTWDSPGYPSISPSGTPSRQRLSNSSYNQPRFRASNLRISISPGIYDELLINSIHKHFSELPSDYPTRAPNKGTTNFLTVDNYRVEACLTPPESDRTLSDIDVDADIGFDRGKKLTNETKSDIPPSPTTPPKEAHLWRRPVQQQVIFTSLLWEDSLPREPIFEETEPPARNLRPVQRRPVAPLRVYSSQLWTQPEPKPTVVVDLWGQTFGRPKSVTPTPRASQKPPRRARRITFLPDIVENPEPLPGKSGALGIFQTPWGPTDSAWPPIIRLSSVVNTQKSRIAVGDADNLSFYDDYDDDDPEEESYHTLIDDLYGNSTGDGVEDSVVWELLEHRRGSSSGGIFPFKSVIVEDDDTDDGGDNEEEEEKREEEKEGGEIRGEDGVNGDEGYEKVKEVAV